MGLKGKFVSVVIASISMGGTGIVCAGSSLKEEPVLNVYNKANYIGVDTIARFQKETGIKVNYRTFDKSDELNQKLSAKTTEFDLVIPSSTQASSYISRGLLRPIDYSQIPNIKNLDISVMTQLRKADEKGDYLIPWLWGYTTIGVNVDQVVAVMNGEPIPANLWGMVFNPKYTSKLKSCGISFPDAPSEVFPAALSYLNKSPYSNNKADYEEAYKLIKSVRADIKKFSNTGQASDLANSRACVTVSMSGSISQARQHGLLSKPPMNIAPLMAQQGASAYMSVDAMAIPVNAKHPGNAQTFINYILKPEVHAELTNATNYTSPNKAAMSLVDIKLQNDGSIFLNKDTISKLTMAKPVNPDISELMSGYWLKIISSAN